MDTRQQNDLETRQKQLQSQHSADDSGKYGLSPGLVGVGISGALRNTSMDTRQQNNQGLSRSFTSSGASMNTSMDTRHQKDLGAKPKILRPQHSADDSGNYGLSFGAGISEQSKMNAKINVPSINAQVDHETNEIPFGIKIPCSVTSQHVLEHFGVFRDLNLAFGCKWYFTDDHVCFDCKTKQDLESVKREYGVYINRIKVKDVSDVLPIETWSFFLNENARQTDYLNQMLEGITQQFKFATGGSKLFFYYTGDALRDFVAKKLKDCLYNITIPFEIYQSPIVKGYLESNVNDVFNCASKSDIDVMSIYCMGYMKEKLRAVAITDDILPVEAWNLVLNDNPRRDSYLKMKIGCKSDIKFFVNDSDSVSMLCISELDDDVLLNKFTSYLHCHNFSHEIVDQPSVKQFLNENKNDVFVCKDLGHADITWLYCFPYAETSLTEKVSRLGFRCDTFTMEYLKTISKSTLTGLVQKYEVKISWFENYIEIEGNGGHEFLKELKCCINYGVHHSTKTDECKMLTSPQDLKEKLSRIAVENGCCARFVPFHPISEYTTSCEGLAYMSTWYLADNSNRVSLVTGDLKNATLDVIIMFVNSSGFGEDPADTKGTLMPYFHHNRRGNLGEIFKDINLESIACPKCFAVVVTATEVDDEYIERKKSLDGKYLQEAMLKCYRTIAQMKLVNVGILLPSCYDNFAIDLNDILKPCKNNPTLGMHFHVCTKSRIQHWGHLINENLRECVRRITYPEFHGIFSVRDDFEVIQSSESLLDIQAECVVIPINKRLDLSDGILANLVNKEAGPQLQKDLGTRVDTALQYMSVVPARPGHLSKKGIKLILFVVTPHWKLLDRNIKIVENMVNKCLTMADKYYCKSVALPILGVGNLRYPIRDVVSTTLDGIDGFKRESALENVSKIIISTPSFGSGPSLDMPYSEVNKSRILLEKMQTKESTSQNEIGYLYVDDKNVQISVVNRSNKVYLLKGHYIDVDFYYNPKKIYESLSLNNSTLRVACEKTKEGIQKAMKRVVLFCENNRITSFALSCYEVTEVRFSEYDLVHEITVAVQDYKNELSVAEYPSRTYKYLSSVVITVSDSFDMNPSLIETPKKSSIPFFSSNRSIEFRMKHFKPAKYCVNTVIIGSSEVQVKSTKEKIVETIHSFKRLIEAGGIRHNAQDANAESMDDKTEDSEVFYSLEEHTPSGIASDTNIKNQFDKSTLGDLKDDNDIDDTLNNVSKSGNTDMNLIDADLQYLVEDSVQASLNPGIVDFLRDSRQDSRFYDKWVNWVKTNLNVRIYDEDGELHAEGSLENIIEFERYLDVYFPKLQLHDTIDDDNETLAVDDNYYSTPSTKSFHVKMSSEIADKIEGMIPERIKSAFQINPISDLKKDKKGIVITCPVEMWHIVNDFILSLKCELENKRAKPEKKIFEIVSCSFRHNNDVSIKVFHDDITSSNTDCIVSPVNARMNTNLGVARAIAKEAGSEYRKKLEHMLEKEKDMEQNECRVTDAGKLKCKHVIHVHCFSSKLNEVNLNVLMKIEEAIHNCFVAAGKIGCTSIALPMFGTGVVGLPVCHFAQEFYRTVGMLKTTSLKEVMFYDIDERNVTEFSCSLMECIDPNDNISVEYLSLEHKKMFIVVIDKASSHLCQPDTVFVERHGSIPAIASKYEFVSVDTEKTGALSEIKVSVPEWRGDMFLFQQSVALSTISVLEEANKLRINHIGIPTFEDSVQGNDEQAALVGETMIQAVIEYLQKKGNRIRTIYLISSSQKVLKKMCSVIRKKH